MRGSQAFVEFTSQQAATATKHLMDGLGSENNQPGQKKHSVIYSNPSHNPFRTLPKDTPTRATKDLPNRTPSGPGYVDRGSNQVGGGNFGGAFRGGRTNFIAPRGGMNSGGFNRNFNGNMNAFGNNNMAFNNPMGGNFGAFNRGGMGMPGGMPGGMRGGMRGGRGGMNGMMGGMPMGGMPLGGMPGAMGGMGMMGAGMQGR
jgi:hypothetical protein